MTPDELVTLTLNELEILGYHIRLLAVESGNWSMSVNARQEIANVFIEPSHLSAEHGSVWDHVYINGHSCGNRSGGIKAYVRLVAGDPHYWRAK